MVPLAFQVAAGGPLADGCQVHRGTSGNGHLPQPLPRTKKAEPLAVWREEQVRGCFWNCDWLASIQLANPDTARGRECDRRAIGRDRDPAAAHRSNERNAGKGHGKTRQPWRGGRRGAMRRVPAGERGDTGDDQCARGQPDGSSARSHRGCRARSQSRETIARRARLRSRGAHRPCVAGAAWDPSRGNAAADARCQPAWMAEDGRSQAAW